MAENLWGDFFDNPQKVKSPKKILDEQADEFNKRSLRAGIICRIIMSYEDHVASWMDLSSPFEESEQKEKDFVLKMQLSVPKLDDYTIVVLAAKYLVSTIYPCQIKDLLSNEAWVEVQSEDDFVEKLKAILNSENMSRLLTNLLSQLSD